MRSCRGRRARSSHTANARRADEQGHRKAEAQGQAGRRASQPASEEKRREGKHVGRRSPHDMCHGQIASCFLAPFPPSLLAEIRAAFGAVLCPFVRPFLPPLSFLVGQASLLRLPPMSALGTRGLRQHLPPERDEFASVFHPARQQQQQPPPQPPSASAVGREMPKTQLSEQQLYDRIEEQIEQLDKKRLMLQQLLKSLRESPHSGRLARSLDSSRVDAAKLARKIHNLFRFVSESSSGRRVAVDDPMLAKFAPLFNTYASVSTALNAVCMESVRFEQEMAGKGGSVAQELAKSRTERQDSVRSRRALVGSASSAVSHGRLPSDDAAAASPSLGPSYSPESPSGALLQQDLDTLPLLEVRGLDTYDAQRKQGDYMQLSSMVRDLASSFAQLREVAESQQANIDRASDGIDAARLETAEGEAQLRQASRYKALGMVLAGGVTGAAVGGPLGALVGLKTGLVSLGVGAGLIGAGGALLGATAAKQMQRARFVSLQPDIEEHELQRIQQQQRGDDGDNNSSSASTASAMSSRSSSVAHSAASSPGAPSQAAAASHGRRKGH